MNTENLISHLQSKFESRKEYLTKVKSDLDSQFKEIQPRRGYAIKSIDLDIEIHNMYPSDRDEYIDEFISEYNIKYLLIKSTLELIEMELEHLDDQLLKLSLA